MVEERIIKPPTEGLVIGRPFRPSKALRNKYWLKAIIIAVIVWVVFYIAPPGIFFLLIFDIPSLAFDILKIMSVNWTTTLFLFTVFESIIVFIALLYIPIYVNSLVYAVGTESGKTEEIYQKRGLITITETHTPLRNVTYTSTSVGLFDRLFSIGSVSIETAGGERGAAPTGLIGLLLLRFRSGESLQIAGIHFYDKLHKHIVRCIREVGESFKIEPSKITASSKSSIRSEKALELLREIREITSE
ncbi:MAG: PH domain-containing protein [Candidatus Thorarchaeota archaeon]